MKSDSEQATDQSTRTHPSGRGDNLDTVDMAVGGKVEFLQESFGHFELLDVIGYGGMGVVYRAKDSRLGREVALKKLLGAAADHPILRGRFETEARAIARLSHPNLMPILEYGQIKGQPYFTMPSLSGITLAERVAEFRNEPRAAMQLMVKIARAVQHAHENQILHRDLKPNNVLFDDKGEPIVADFGVAKLMDAGGDLTHTGAVVGTPAYMSPEQAAGRLSEISPRSDIWALGIMLYELVTGERPFRGLTREEVTPQILDSAISAPTLIARQLDETLSRIILKCLQKLPADRYQSAGDLADHLQAWLDGHQPAVTLPRPPKWKWAYFAGAALSILIILALVAVLWRPRLKSNSNSSNIGDTSSALAKTPLQLIQDELLTQKKVDLLASNGQPRHSVRLTTGQEFRDTNEPGVLTIASQEAGLLELGRGLGLQNFRFHALVRQNSQLKPGSRAGIFVGGSEHSTQGGRAYACLVLEISELGGVRKAPEVVGTLTDYPLVLWLPKGNSSYSSGKEPWNYDFVDSSNGWRSLKWEVRPHELTAYHWAGEHHRMARAEVVNQVTTAAQTKLIKALDRTNITPNFLPSDGIGIYLDGCDVSFRDVWLEKIE